MKMNEIDERIKYNKKAVELLRRYRELGDFSKFSESELIIATCEYLEEIEYLNELKKKLNKHDN